VCFTDVSWTRGAEMFTGSVGCGCCTEDVTRNALGSCCNPVRLDVADRSVVGGAATD
jgi:hypothetical protein